MKKICLIRQPAGIGDIIFCQKIAYTYQDKGYDILWPVSKYYIDVVNKYMGNFNYVSEDEDFPYKKLYLDEEIKEIYETDECLVIPLHGHEMLDRSVMVSKYVLVNIDYKDWKNFFNFRRYIKKEDELFYDLMGLKDNERYNFVNYYFATQPNEQRVKEIRIDNKLKNIELEIIEGFSIFDWCKIIENAENIYTAETCFNYLIEKIDVKAKSMVMYSKKERPDFRHVDMLFEKNWTYNYII